MIGLIKDLFNFITELGKLHAGYSAKAMIFLLIVANVISLLLLIIFLLSFLLFKNKLAKIWSFVLFSFFSLVFIFQFVLYVDMALIEPNWIKVEYVNVKIPRLAKDLKGKRIIFFSDLHVNKIGFRERKLIKIVNSLNPDIILFGGGLTGEGLKNLGDGIPQAAKVLKSLKAKLSVWAVTDNTDDYLFEKEEYKNEILNTGVKYLFNSNVKVGKDDQNYFFLVGTEDAFYGKNGLENAMTGASLDAPKILLTHSPNIIDKAKNYSFDLVLAGKTHGGHTGIKILRNMFDYIKDFKYISGLYKVDGTYLYVNRGIGDKASAFRLLCRPEVTVFNITD